MFVGSFIWRCRMLEKGIIDFIIYVFVERRGYVVFNLFIISLILLVGIIILMICLLGVIIGNDIWIRLK